MRKYILMCLLCTCYAWSGKAQMYTVTGFVYDEHGVPLPGCHVHYTHLCEITDINGKFRLNVTEGNTNISFSFIGYHTKDTSFIATQDAVLTVMLKADNRLMDEVSVIGNGINTRKSKKNEVINARFVAQNQTGTFIKSIERLPGVNAMDIGANASKPIIRTL
ncbi:carboxypeptidase-like regulatory domain-containing protein [Saccharicrinis fermentans]|uniref:TonB-linked outer membrane protein, SusC/RagA family n=1 Tax=Saccharicrinis fermentans DSM 9555 = JCM 21142 TaxID=869213 RepID=W7XTZ6_9BACT|nr:carboxypeptidase-like regulatory domain-containing protein [Saccharicrinis fermentans]GAF01485.1 TonB-linked outer membrane protein, SusC/RagA family [Saccharicrinis fermentans DSM 9555 = JCM 21142]